MDQISQKIVNLKDEIVKTTILLIRKKNDNHEQFYALKKHKTIQKKVKPFSA